MVFLFGTVILNKKYDNIMRSFMMFSIAYSVLFGVKTSVRIIDKIDHTRIPTQVDNVPLALALWGSVTSKAGYVITQVMDQAFALPGDEQYAQTGMLFGAKLMLESETVAIGDSHVKYSIGQYTKQCVYPALIHGYVSIKDLMKSTQILSDLQKAAKPGWFMNYKDDKGKSTVENCSDGYSELAKSFADPTKTGNDALNKIANVFSKPTDTQTVAKNAFLSSLPNAYAFFMKNSESAVNLLFVLTDKALPGRGVLPDEPNIACSIAC